MQAAAGQRAHVPGLSGVRGGFLLSAEVMGAVDGFGTAVEVFAEELKSQCQSRFTYV